MTVFLRSFLTPFALFFALAGCAYSSMVDAEQACSEWAQNGIKYQYKGTKFKHPLGIDCRRWPRQTNWIRHEMCVAEMTSLPHVHETTNRWCNLEEETRQYLGWEDLDISSEKILLEKVKLEFKNKQIKHYFRY